MHTHDDETPPKGTGVLPERKGRRMTDMRELTFPIAMDRIVMWLSAGLIGWLCYSSMTMREQLVVMVERSSNFQEQMKTFHGELERLTLADKQSADQIRKLQVQAAKNGWRVDE